MIDFTVQHAGTGVISPARDCPASERTEWSSDRAKRTPELTNPEAPTRGRPTAEQNQPARERENKH